MVIGVGPITASTGTASEYIVPSEDVVDSVPPAGPIHVAVASAAATWTLAGTLLRSTEGGARLASGPRLGTGAFVTCAAADGWETDGNGTELTLGDACG
jgi:hypothetical protein